MSARDVSNPLSKNYLHHFLRKLLVSLAHNFPRLFCMVGARKTLNYWYALLVLDTRADTRLRLCSPVDVEGGTAAATARREGRRRVGRTLNFAECCVAVTSAAGAFSASPPMLGSRTTDLRTLSVELVGRVPPRGNPKQIAFCGRRSSFIVSIS